MYKSSVIKHTQQHLIFVEILPIPTAQSSMMSIFLDILVRKKTHEVSPKFNRCKMEYLLILRFKGPLRFSMFRTRLSRKLAWPCVFLNGLGDFSCRVPSWRPCTFE